MRVTSRLAMATLVLAALGSCAESPDRVDRTELVVETPGLVEVEEHASGVVLAQLELS